MRFLIIGAGASLEECIRADVPKENWLPLIKNFGEKCWSNKNETSSYPPLLYEYLKVMHSQEEIGRDPVKLFRSLEAKENEINVEHYFEWIHLNYKSIKKPNTDVAAYLDYGYITPHFPLRGLSLKDQLILREGASRSDNLNDIVRRAIGLPLSMKVISAFSENGKSQKLFKDIRATHLVSSKLNDCDLVFSLNYDTLFEIGLTQIDRSFVYHPSKDKKHGLKIVKPHGSLNFATNRLTGELFIRNPSDFSAAHEGLMIQDFLIPPRTNKKYSENKFTKFLLDEISYYRPTKLTFWGVGLTQSDIDLNKTYRLWGMQAKKIEFINPDEAVFNNAKRVLNTAKPIIHYKTLDEWLEAN